MFSVSVCLYRACSTHLISSNLSCNLCLWYFDQLVHLNKEINANVYHHSLWEYSKCSTVHLNGIWHLIWRFLLKPVLGGCPVLSGHYSIPGGCPLNTGFIVVPIAKVSLVERVCCKLRALPTEAFGHVQSLTLICRFNVKKIESVMWRLVETWWAWRKFCSLCFIHELLCKHWLLKLVQCSPPQLCCSNIFSTQVLMFSFDLVVH